MAIFGSKYYAVYTSNAVLQDSDGPRALAIVAMPHGIQLSYCIPFLNFFLLMSRGFYSSALLSLLSSLFFISGVGLLLKLTCLLLCAYTVSSLNEHKLERTGYQLATVIHTSNPEAAKRAFLSSMQTPQGN